ncbi:YebC/PmpR family DNA-binding transcriptional regulator [Thiospirochaeta perfilievii]|uniref:Probable transcriptional regulatory protein EW093_00710 n=1 Tax=Thiospirochaeta perfilievii TaxID=252967 RepID=A0A5C1Q8S7_9SPIO|nr:YebC/PmpR family DNA-binding transcriptional regulator [Thiospirochaeta perfilievii]QEN03286.1 YebC/PmpR family DNA-binding transcriptional regulator [Thiospirochaeta perfilievii]
MSGHSKWATIKHKKGALDAKRGKIFCKIIKEITVAARMGGGDEETNPRLRTSLLKAKAANMPKDNITRAIKKGCGETDGAIFMELVYEGYGQGGVGLIIEALTDNKNRTSADVKSILNKGGGSLAATGAVSYQFNRKGVITYDLEGNDFEAIFETALEAGAEDVTNDNVIEVICEPSDFEAVLNALEAAGYEHLGAEITMVPDNTIELDEEKTEKLLNLIDKLEDHEDVQSVSSNLA